MVNRVAPGVVALCLAAALPPGAAMGGAATKKPVVESASSRRPHQEKSSAVKSLNAVQRIKVGSTIDMEQATKVGVSAEVLELALTATSCAVTSGAIDTPPTLTVIDYSLPSTKPRMWVFDLATGELLFRELVAHGRNTGDNFARKFSNQMDSRQTSLGLFVTDSPYMGSNGYSLRLDGLDVGFNDRARDRAIVMHGAPYVNEKLAATQGRIGRSWGCPALRTAIASKVIDRIRGGSVIFSYYPDQKWLQSSKFLKGCGTNLIAAD